MFKNFAHDDAPHDPVSRLASLTSDLPGGTANDLAINPIAYNPASQIVSQMRAPDAYAWRGHSDGTWTGTANGLNQLTQYGAKSLSHDPKGNVTAFGSDIYAYSSENLLLTGPGSSTLAYDGLTRLRQIVSGGSTTRFAYDGLDRIAEYNGSNALQRRYVFGSSIDEPIVWYEGSGTTDRRFLSSDERGSIVSVTNSSGALLGINRYDEFGIPQSTNLGKWGYTGQAWLPEIGVYYYKARMYEPELGRFLQPDPIGYVAGMNLYAYVGNDPINRVDPLGLDHCLHDPSYDATVCGHLPSEVVVYGDPCSVFGSCISPDDYLGFDLFSQSIATFDRSFVRGGGDVAGANPGEETIEERREELVRRERERVERNAFCGNLRAQAALDGLADATGVSLGAALLDGGVRGFFSTLRGGLTRGLVAASGISIIYRMYRATEGHEQC